jgi:hypothetical protein
MILQLQDRGKHGPGNVVLWRQNHVEIVDSRLFSPVNSLIYEGLTGEKRRLSTISTYPRLPNAIWARKDKTLWILWIERIFKRPEVDTLE